MNIWDIFIIIIIAAVVSFAVRSIRNGKKRGCSGCCTGCPHHCPVEKAGK